MRISTISWLCVLMVLLCTGVASSAQAACVTLNFSGLSTTATFSSGTGEYKPYDATSYPQTISFRVAGLVNAGTCNYFITLRAGQSGNSSNRYMALSGQRLNYQVYTDTAMSTPISDVAGANSSNVPTGTFGAVLGVLVTQNQSLRWTITPQQLRAASGTRYTDAGVTLELYEGIPGAPALLRDSANLTFQSRVESSVDLSIVSPGGSFNVASTSGAVNFGNATSSAARQFDISVRSNNGYSVTMQSANGQKLLRTGTPSATLPYTLTVGATPLTLTANTSVPAGGSAGAVTPLTGSNLPVTVKLGTLTGLEQPGTYQDTIAISVTAN